MQKNYKTLIVFFLLFSLLFLVSSSTLFFLKSSWVVSQEKTVMGVLKVLLPHIFAFGLYIFVVVHFLLFTRYKETKTMQWLIYVTFFSGFLEVSSSFMMLSDIAFFGILKFVSFVALNLTLLYSLFLIQKSLINR